MKSIAGILIGLLIIVGCSSGAPHHSSSLSYNKTDEYKKIRIRRVLLLPFEYNIDRDAIIDEVTEAFAVELRKIGSFEVVVPSGSNATLTSELEIWE
jgi:PBP1b-binding outer membrane lipoprotein LpoB